VGTMAAVGVVFAPVADAATPKNKLISHSSTNNPGDKSSSEAALSATGRSVAFSSNATDLVGNDIEPLAISNSGRIIVFRSDADNLLKNDANGVGDVFYHDRITGKTRSANIAANGKQSPEATGREPSISGDGRFIGFSSSFQGIVINGANGAVEDVFRRGPIR
jgi:hypothetical protein